VRAVHTTTANEHDSKGFKPLMKKVPKSKLKKGTFADKGYKVPANDEYLEENKIKNRIQHKAYRNRHLTDWQVKFNKLISQDRYKVERTFGGMKRWFGAGIARYVGIEKTHTQHVMEAIAYNLYRSPGIVMSKCLG
jgi:IS5 family transposase